MQTGARTRIPRPLSTLFSAVATLVGLAACPDRPVSEVPSHPATQTSTTINVGNNRDIDLLFVIDNSLSMGDEQTSLVANFTKFMDTLTDAGGGLPNVHIGVVSSDVGAGGFGWSGCAKNGGNGDNGLLQATARSQCTPPSGMFIEDVANPDGTRKKNYSDSLGNTFKCIAELGTAGCGFEHHMESMKRALDGSRPENAGFLRKDAYLAVVFIADEDDCSAADGAVFDNASAIDNPTSALGPHSLRCTEWAVDCDGLHLPRTPGTYATCLPRNDSPFFEDPTKYGDFLRSLKPGHPELVLVGGIVGLDSPFGIGDNDDDDNPVTTNPNELHLLPSCGTDAAASESGDGAVPPVRFKALLDSFGLNGIRASICENDLTPALQQIAAAIASKFVLRCLPANIDMSDLHPERPGVQPDCAVVEVVDEAQSAIHACRMLDQPGAPMVAPGNALPCWYVGEDADNCSAEGQNGFTVEVERDHPPDKNATLRVDCVGTDG
jgi:hypothetical protein